MSYRICLTLSLLALLWGCSAEDHPIEPIAQTVQQARPATIPWFQGSVEDAFATAAHDNKPIFLYWGAEWCPPCHELKATIFRQQAFIRQSALFLPVYLDGDTARAQKYGEQFGVQGYPTVIIFRPDGQEITRIPGGMNLEQYVGVLELALDALVPVSELVERALAGEPLRSQDWTLLASYAWDQDRGRVLAEREPREILQGLANACPDTQPIAKSNLQMLSLAHWSRSELREESEAAQYRTQLDAVLADDALSAANLNTLIYHSAAMSEALAPADQRAELEEAVLKPLIAAITDDSTDALVRLDAVYTWVQFRKAQNPDENLSSQQETWLEAQVTATRGQLNSYQQHAALNTLWQVYLLANMEEQSRAALHKGIEVSEQPYYFMASMAELEESLGNEAQMLHWYRQAWHAAEGPATRFQWGTNYLFALLAVEPDNLAELNTASAAVFAELSAQPDGLHQRNRMRMDRLSEKLLSWSASETTDSTQAAQRNALLNALRETVATLCKSSAPEGEALESCENFLRA